MRTARPTATVVDAALELLASGEPVGDDWRDRAACRDMPNELFFPTRGESVAEAKAACARCPVAVRCLAFALESREQHGIWGGCAERDRRVLRRQLGSAA
ncbi:MAG: WhiB family transcriptional regulator [Acidimicrobiia bacterium]|nr:WhiB family transcriptional regulator [Acidimicrobiia bacterium]